MVGEIRVVVLERHEVARLGLERILESVDESTPGPPVAVPDGARRLVLVSGGKRDGTAPALSMTADGYLVLRDVTAESLRAALLTVLNGQMRLPDEVTLYLLDVAGGDGPGAPAAMPQLSKREDDVLELLVAGCSNQEIAAELGISIHGAKRHVSSLLAKFDSPSRSHLVSRVLQARAHA
ncbi:MAG TPA: LuxR C-terminal-related transcriptional regulator [Acidimicrobiales bacterium]